MMEKDYTRQSQMACKAYVEAHPYFHGPVISMDDGDANFSLKEAAELIAQSRIEKQRTLQRIAAQEQSQEALAQVREDVSLLPDRESQRIEQEWIEQGALQAKRYAEAINKGATPRSTQGVNASVTEGVISWIAKKRRQNFWPKKVK